MLILVCLHIYFYIYILFSNSKTTPTQGGLKIDPKIYIVVFNAPTELLPLSKICGPKKNYINNLYVLHFLSFDVLNIYS